MSRGLVKFKFAKVNRGDFKNVEPSEAESMKNDFSSAIRIRPDEPLPYRLRAIVLAATEHFPEALADYDRVVELSPLDDSALSLRGSVNRLAGHDEEALRDYKRALEINPQNSDALTGIGDIYLEIKKDVDAAISAYQGAAKVQPSDPEILERLRAAKERKDQADM